MTPAVSAVTAATWWPEPVAVDVEGACSPLKPPMMSGFRMTM